MKIACIGGGPAGLYFAISMKLRDPAHEVEVFERNPPGVTFGWGVVFSDQTVENLTANDPLSAEIIADEFAHWDDIDVHIHGECIRSSGHGFIGIGRKRLLEILQQRARELGVVLHFEAECDPADPQVARLRSGDRRRRRQLALPRRAARKRSGSTSTCAPTSSSGSARPRCSTPSPSRSRRPSTAGSGRTPIASPTTARPSSSNVREETWARARLRPMSQDESIAACERIFAKYLDGHPLLSNATHLIGSAAWLNFRRIKCERWNARQCHPARRRRAHRAFLDRVGHQAGARGCDQAGRGAQPARACRSPQAMDEYVAERNLEVLKLQNSARNSTEWFETLAPLPAFRAGAIRLFAADPEPADQPRESAAARQGLAGRRRALVLGERDRREGEQGGAADVRAVQAARDGAGQPHRGVADGDVFGGRRDAQRLPPRPLWRARDRAARAWCSPR